MTAVLLHRESGVARWSRRIALFAAQVAIVSVVLHRFGVLESLSATNLLAIGGLIGFVALMMAGAAAVGVWRHGLLGGSHAAVAALISLVVLAGPLWHLPDLLFTPKINDVSTDTAAPPRFTALSARHAGEGAQASASEAPAADPEVPAAAAHPQAYPDIRPMVLERSAEAAFDLAREAIARMEWKIVDEQRPTGSEPGRIEAVAVTPVMAYKDDVVVRVSMEDGKARIDMRSASRYGEHDFGTNARRIRRLFAEVRSGLEKGEREALDMALAKRAREAREQARLERERREAARQKALEEERKRLSQLREEARQFEPSPAQPAARDEPERRVQRRARERDQDPYKFWRQFGE